MWKLNWINHVIFGVVILLLAAGCKKEEISSDKEYPITHWPIAKALEVTNKTDTTAKLNGTVNSFGLPTTVTFEYGTTTSYGRTVSAYQIPVSGSGIIEVSANISGLTTDTIYHFRVGAENSLWTNFYSSDKTFYTKLTLTDVDANIYYAVEIGSQVWMAENLKTTKYRNGDLIGTTSPSTLDISAETRPKYQWAYDGIESNVANYGRLYTWYAVTDLRNVCPTGWHLPTDTELTTLTNFLGGESVAGHKLKDESGFAAIPGGLRDANGFFSEVGITGQWWSSTMHDVDNAWYRHMSWNSGNDAGFSFAGVTTRDGFSVRCVKDSKNPSIPILTTTDVSTKTLNTATSGGYITSDGGATVKSCGVCWNSLSNPTIANSKTIDEPGYGSFTSNLTGLSENSTYYLRAYATNSTGTAYGDEITFTTKGQAPTVTTVNATNLSATGATLNGTVNASYLSTTVTFEYGSTISYGNTATANPGTVTGDSSTNVSADITGLTAGTTYHFRVKAENSRGVTVYGSDIEFTLLPCSQFPTATTLSATNISSIGATLNGTVNAHGYPTTVTFIIPASRGSRTVTAVQSPVTGDTYILVTADISGLAPGTTYRFIVKAENSCGTVYGGYIYFTLLPPCPNQIPTVTTLSATNISATGATLNGTVNAHGSPTKVTFTQLASGGRGGWIKPVTAVQSPVTGDTDILVTADISGLAPGSAHTFRVEATNSCGTVYGNASHFTTSR